MVVDLDRSRSVSVLLTGAYKRPSLVCSGNTYTGQIVTDSLSTSSNSSENVRVSDDRLQSKPSLIPFLDGLYDRETPTGREPYELDDRQGLTASSAMQQKKKIWQGTIRGYSSCSWIQTNHWNPPRHRLSSSVYQTSVLFLRDDCPLFCRSLLPTHLQHVAVPLTC